MKNVRKLARTALSTAVLVGVLSARSDAGALEALPSNVTAFVYVKDMSELNSRFSAMATASGLTEMAKELADPMASIKSSMPKNGAGIRDSGDFTIAFVDSADPNLEESMLVLVPVSDFDAFVTNFEGEDGAALTRGENGIFSTKSEGKKLFLAKWGDYAAVGQNEKTVSMPEKSGLTLDDWTRKQIESNDVTSVMLTAEMYRIDPARAEKIIKQFNKLSGMAGQMSGGMMPINSGEVIGDAFSKAVIERFISDAEVAVMGLSFNEKGIRFNAKSQFKTGTYLANMMMKAKAPEKLPINKVPNQNFMMYGAMAYDSEIAVQIMDDFLNKIGKDLNNTGDPLAGMSSDQIAQMRNMIASGRSGYFAANSWAMSDDKKKLLQPGFVFIEGDGAKLKSSMMELTKSASVKPSGDEEGQKPRPGMSPQIDVKLTENARTIAGTSFDQLDVEVKGVPMAGFASSSTFMGATQNGLFAYRDLSDETVSNVLAANDNSITLSEGYQRVSADLPANRCLELYVQPEQVLAGIGTMFAQMFGMPIELTPPVGLPPIGFAVSHEERVLSAEVVVPSETIAGTSKFVKETVEKAFGGPEQEDKPAVDEDL